MPKILESKPIVRSFLYDKEDTKIPLVDFNPLAPPEEIVKFYTGQYPELTNASIEPEFEGDNIIFNISTSVGTKG